ncbi:MAG TPA: vitamin K epoxide reductase family protein [Anaerolineales bacterium]|nr:vitamin K epoxide reductase family protein [Anaerolineales bacterium]
MKLLARSRSTSPLWLLVGLLLGWHQVYPALAQNAVVHAVLFYSPTCPHCHKVISEDLPPILEQYGEQVQIIGVNTTTQGGQALFQAAIERYNIPPEQQGVPMLIIGDVILIGSVDIPERLPQLIEHHLLQGGVDWPDIPGLAEALGTAQPESTPTSPLPDTPTPPGPTASNPQPATPLANQGLAPAAPTPTDSPSGLVLDSHPTAGLIERLSLDPAGNALAIIVLTSMLISVGGVLAFVWSPTKSPNSEPPSWVIPILCVIGVGVAGYMTYVETAQVSAVCGPVGDCNTVQQSEYARLFGILPLGVLGLVGYTAMLVAWLISRFGGENLAAGASLALLGMSLTGTLFSIYLTFLEPFVIGATCAWCLTSAIIMTALLWLAVFPGRFKLYTLFHREKYSRL